jgi:protein-S-isoprenylcysteine O-methyltransferase Ste14
VSIKTKDYLLVAVQFILFVLYLYNPFYKVFTLTSVIKYVALFLVFIGIVILILSVFALRKSLSPFPSPVKNGSLINSGVYQFVRHPIYTSILISTAGWALYTGSLFRIFIFIALFLLFEIKSNFEEKLLMKKYDNYLKYKKTTGKYFPKIN